MPTSSSVRDLTRLFEPNLNDRMTRSESNLSVVSKKSTASRTLECNRQLSLTATPGDEHVAEVKYQPSDTSTNDTSGTTSSGTASSGAVSSDVGSSVGSSTPSKGTQSQPAASQSPIPADGNSSDSSNVQHQELQRSPPVAVPAPEKPLGHLGGNIQMFLKVTEFTENGTSRFREGKKLFDES